MSELISGEEAKKAWANGEIVQWRQDFSWNDLGFMNMLGIFDANDIEFRLKPRTIAINGIEVPAPFEPKDGDTCFILDTEQDEGFYRFTFSENSGIHKNYVYLGAWRTEEEIKQVVAALRSVFGKK